MSVRALWRAMLILAVSGMALGATQVLDLPAGTRYDAPTYASINSTLYPLFSSVGGSLQVLAIVAGLWLAFQIRSQPAVKLTVPMVKLTVYGPLCLVLSAGLWFVLVHPVSIEWGRLASDATASFTEIYGRLRSKWDYGHPVAFAAWLVGVSLLVHSALGARSHHSVSARDGGADVTRATARQAGLEEGGLV